MSKLCSICGKQLSFRDSFVWEKEPVCRSCLKHLELKQKAGEIPEKTLQANSPEAISRGYDSSILVRRWAATWLDFITFFGVIMLLSARADIEEPSVFWPFLIFLVIAYYVVLEGLTGWTIGKLVLAIRVVDDRGSTPGIRKACIRTLLRLVEVNPVLAGGIPAGIVVLASKKRQRIGDILADTYVIKKADLVHN